MEEGNDIELRKAMWVNLSELYLDTELQPYDFKRLAKYIHESPFSYEQLREIDKIAVFPVLYPNLLSVAGVWDGFDEEWLITSILKKKKKRNFLTRNYYDFKYFCMKGMFKEQWKVIETELQVLERE